MGKYMVEGFGDIGNSKYDRGRKYLPKRVFDSLESALLWLKEWATVPSDEQEGDGYHKLDCEDDRVLVWEILESGHRKVVWHFSGWHWNADEFPLPQGIFPGDKKSVYDINMENY